MKHKVLILVGLAAFQGLLDFFYAEALPNLVVSPSRAFTIGATAFVLLWLVQLLKRNLLPPVLGGLSVLSSAYFGALLVQADYLVSKSVFSAIVHIAILIVTYLVLEKVQGKCVKKGA